MQVPCAAPHIGEGVSYKHVPVCVHQLSFPTVSINYFSRLRAVQVSVLDPILPQLQAAKDGETLLGLLSMVEHVGEGWARMARADKQRLAEVRTLPARVHGASSTDVRLVSPSQVGVGAPSGGGRCCALAASRR
jgi:hypothetical protein